ncbi:head completion/stabilization protein [Marinobacter nanhaiticus D15-8W]|uniref:Head protein n=1 Tax=Marinobacter nanhaiticus D15-8W TaxID=626887 RepID=N6W3B4_9GAMM|nr:head completion/stabilization protein [Marinobacter nanhaiticus]ENO14594.1 head protein [Marinobacter nanhaiticus D15-8W]BES69721.1 head completion/stabilization protein [Marinobacter nanhaiticus D15-8W]BES69766.1 head completion/stabilization protein [Marinobacter nanhaiticus D15-8W]
MGDRLKVPDRPAPTDPLREDRLVSGYSFAGGSPAPAEPVTLTNVAFFPDIDTGEFLTLYRIPTEIDAQIIEHQLLQAMTRTNHSLQTWRATQESEGHTALSDVPAESLGNESELVRLYKRAVMCEAKAELLKETETVDRRAVAENAAKAGEETEDKYREFAAEAIRVIAGLNRIGVALI